MLKRSKVLMLAAGLAVCQANATTPARFLVGVAGASVGTGYLWKNYVSEDGSYKAGTIAGLTLGLALARRSQGQYRSLLTQAAEQINGINKHGLTSRAFVGTYGRISIPTLKESHQTLKALYSPEAENKNYLEAAQLDLKSLNKELTESKAKIEAADGLMCGTFRHDTFLSGTLDNCMEPEDYVWDLNQRACRLQHKIVEAQRRILNIENEDLK